MPSETSLTPPSVGRGLKPQAPPCSTDEQALIAAVLQRDRKAAAEFVARYADPVYAYVRRRLAPRDELVEDVVQDVFLVAFQKLDTFAAQSSLVGWLLGIARHKIEDVYRARLREPDPFPDDGEVADASTAVDPKFDASIDAARARDKTWEVLGRLPAAYSAALLWRYWEGRPIKDMAMRSGKTEKAIERLLARARAQFRRLWEAS